MSKLNDLIFEVAEHAGAPLFIPALIFWIFASMQRRQLRDIHNIMALVQRDTTLLDQFLKTSDSNASMARQAKFDDIHSLLTQQHARLTSGLTEFVGDLGVALDRGLDRIKTILGDWKLPMDPDVHKDFQKYVWQLRREAEAALQHRDRLLSRIDLQLKVVREPLDVFEEGDC
jgi:hypothetical protein